MKRILTSLLLAASCSSDPLQSDGAVGEEVIARAVAATYRVQAEGCSLISHIGTGVAVGNDLVMTTAHTVAGSSSVEVVDASGRTSPAALLALDPESDLALLGVDAATWLPIGRAETGEAVVVLSARIGGETISIPTSVVRVLRVTIEDIYNEATVERRAFEFNADIVQGDSGAAVVDNAGSLIGIVYGSSRSRSAGFAVRYEELNEMLATVPKMTGTSIDSGPCT